MKVRTVWLMTTLIIVLLGFSPPSEAQEPTNLLDSNCGFETGALAPWGSYGGLATFTVVKDCVGASVPQGPIEGNYCLNVKVSGAGANRWDAAFQAPMATPPGRLFLKGKTYTFSIFLKSKSGTAQVYISAELSQDPYTAYGTLAVTMTDKWAEYYFTTAAMPADVNPAHITIHVAYTAQEFWADDAKWYEGAYVPTVPKTKLSAVKPAPGNDATDVPRDVTLTWQAGPFADTHNVYLGAGFEDVNTADIAQAVSVGQTQTTFQPAGPLEYDKTYYWRVDEANAPPSDAVFKGDVWSFTTEPYSYILTGVKATASTASTAQGMTAQKTVDGSGLSADGLHSTLDSAMWLSAPGIPLPSWIRFEFDQSYMLQNMQVWNSNQKIESVIGFGAKNVTVEYSLDGTAWTPLGDMEFAQASGTDDYAANTVVDMAGVEAKFVRLTIRSNHGSLLPQVGLSEVRFSYIPVKARQPSPAANAQGVVVDATLDWRDGRKATSHKVYLAKDSDSVAGGAALVDTTTASAYQPSPFDFGTTYYWKVDEVNDTVFWPGDIWSFATAEWAAIDDFESYSNESPNRVFQTWIDGIGFSKDDFFPNGNPGNATGAMVGYDPAVGEIMETAITHGGGQSMPVEYNNTNTPYYSEVERTWETSVNCTTHGATDVDLWFRGRPAPFIETASGVTLSGGGADIYNGTDEFRFAYKQLTGDGSITVRVDNVQTLADWTKSGVMIRETLNPLSMQAHMISAAAQSLAEWQYRAATGSTTTTQFNTTAGTNPLPVWLRLTRAGNAVTGEWSVDGKTWTKLTTTAANSSTTLTLPGSVYIGMVVCANAAGQLAVADFSEIRTTGNVTGQWQTADIGVEQPGNGPDSLYLVVQDGAGKSKTLVHPNAQATCVNEWTQWKIPLADFTGVNMANLKKMVVGIGSRSQPKASGSGMLFIDDIEYGRPIVPAGQ